MYDSEVFLGLLAGVLVSVLIMVLFYTILNHMSTQRRKNQGIKNMGDSSRVKSCNNGVCPKENPNAVALAAGAWKRKNL